MRIAINTRLLLKNRLEGIGWFTYETLSRIVKQHPEHSFFFLFDRPYSNEFIFASNVTPVVLGPQSRHPILWYIWFEHSVAKFINHNSIDVFLSPDGYLSLASNIPQIVVVHDINFYHNRNRLPWLTSWYMNHFTPKYVNKAVRVVTVSNFSKHDICNTYHIANSKVDVVYNGVGNSFSNISAPDIEEVRASISDSQPYFVFVGAFNPRKNISGLIKAFDVFKARTNSKIKLVIVGEKMFKAKGINQTYKQSAFKNDIVLLGRMDRNKLNRVVGAALAMIYPSFFEGFGVPLIEAMSCNVPLAVSNTSSLPEVASKAAIYFDPTNTNQIADSMQKLAFDPELRYRLIEAGKLQRTKFSWDCSAEKLFKVIETVADSNVKRS